MVYNALRLFMELNPDLFDEVMQQYKQRVAQYVFHVKSGEQVTDPVIQGPTASSGAIRAMAEP